MTAGTGAPHGLSYATSGDSIANFEETNEAQIKQIARRLPIADNVVIEVTASDTGEIDVDFPATFFENAPRVVASVYGSDHWIASTDDISSSGVTIKIRRPAGPATGSITVHYIACRRTS